MSIQVEDYFARETFQKMKAFADKQETPFVVIDTAMIAQAYDDLRAGFEFAKVYYAVKANPAVEIIDLLKEKGSSFDIASIYELDKVLGRGVSADHISYGNTIKKSKDIRYFYDKGVRLFATDSEADLRNIAKAAPGSKVYVRILTEGSTTADWPLSRKFGCQTDMAMDLLILARDLGLVPYGISFHVGSQQRDISVWDAASRPTTSPAPTAWKPTRKKSSASSRKTSVMTCRKSSWNRVVRSSPTPASWSAKWCWSHANPAPR
jgi:ornithine decarboxylase